MNKKYLLPLLGLILLLTSCGETKEEPGLFHRWPERSQALVDSLSNTFDAGSDANLYAIRGNKNGSTSENLVVVAKDMNVYYKKIGNFYKDEDSPWDAKYKEGIELDVKPILTSTVKLYYRGMLITNEGAVHKLPAASIERKFSVDSYKMQSVFDGNINKDHTYPQIDKDERFLEGSVDGFVPGFTEMLQQMTPGDRVEVYIPYKYGYGKNGSGSIPGYSTLVFDLTLVDITKF